MVLGRWHTSAAVRSRARMCRVALTTAGAAPAPRARATPAGDAMQLTSGGARSARALPPRPTACTQPHGPALGSTATLCDESDERACGPVCKSSRVRCWTDMFTVVPCDIFLVAVVCARIGVPR
eukprot:5056501-Prymnesium_polylepis.1